MPINIPDNLPAAAVLKNENIFVMDESRAIHQDIRPQRIVILNIMPVKHTTETHLLRLLSNTPLQIMNSIFKSVENANSEYEKYVALTQIPNVYDPDARKFTPDGINIMTSGSGNLDQIVNVYLTVLSYFVKH